MAIRMMTSKEDFEKNPANIEVVTNYPGYDGTLYMKTSHEGLVLGEREMNGYSDSDFYAIVWNPEKGAPEEIMFGTTRGWSYPNGCSVDATPEVRAAYDSYLAAQRKAADEAYYAAEAKKPAKGKLVKVVKGRKIQPGVIGRVFWYGACYNQFKRANEMRVGILNALGEKIFLSADYVEVVAE